MTSQRILAAFAAAAAMSAAVPAVAQPGSVTPVDVTAKASTAITISLAGKTAATVYHEIRIASDTVCGNAVTNGELSFVDHQWCNAATRATAVKTYQGITQMPALAQSGFIRLTAR